MPAKDWTYVHIIWDLLPIELPGAYLAAQVARTKRPNADRDNIDARIRFVAARNICLSQGSHYLPDLENNMSKSLSYKYTLIPCVGSLAICYGSFD
jgi:hypothetical protein